MAAGGKGMTLANVKTFLEMSGADREASEIINAHKHHLRTIDPSLEEHGYAR